MKQSHDCFIAGAMVLAAVFVTQYVGCGSHDNRPASRAIGTAVPALAAETPYLMPYLEELGTAVVAYGRVPDHLTLNLLNYEPGVPFAIDHRPAADGSIPLRPALPLIAIWSDRTIIWAVPTLSGPSRRYLRSRISTREYSELVKAIDRLRSRPPWHSPDSVAFAELGFAIGIVYGESRYELVSLLDRMEAQRQFFHVQNGQVIEYSADEVTFDDFCDRLPIAEARRLKQYAELRGLIRKLLPDVGEEFDAESQVKWVVQLSRQAGQHNREPRLAN